MISEVVILPTCFKEKNISNELIQVFRDIERYPIFIQYFENSNWIDSVKSVDTNESIPDALRKSLQVFLKKIRNRIILVESEQKDFSKIINWLKGIKAEGNIDCVFVTSDEITLCKKQKINFYQNIHDIILSDSTKWDELKVSGVEIKKTKEETEKIIKTICKNTDKVILVDGYFDPTKRNVKRTIDLISTHLGQSKNYLAEDKKIIMHAPKKMVQDIELFKKNVAEELNRFKDKHKIDFEFYLWNYIHDRSFLTDVICLESTSGLAIVDDDSSGDNIQTKWFILEDRLANEQFEKYDIDFDDEVDHIKWKYAT